MKGTWPLSSNFRLFGLVFCGLLLSACSQEFETFHENGQLETRGTLKREKREGLWERFHENGQLKERENYRDGVREGAWEHFYS
ncbi:uncharacterized protein METZ01_LOCUS172896, partial [marine metagenome]